jgi:hypothetical protein
VLDAVPLELVEVHRAQVAVGLPSGEDVGDDHQDGVAEGDQGALLAPARGAASWRRLQEALAPDGTGWAQRES